MLLQRYNVDYVLIGPPELASLKVNEQFWSRYPRLALEGAYRIYQTSGSTNRSEGK